MPVKKCILMLCVLLALVSPAAAFVQGDEQFFYSSDMMDEINKIWEILRILRSNIPPSPILRSS